MPSNDEDFAAMFEASLAHSGGQVAAKRLRTGEVITGTVVSIGKEAVFVDVGTRSEGQIARHELEDREGQLGVAVGDRVRATVARGGDRPVLVVAFGRNMDTSALELAVESGAPVKGTVSKVVKAGLEVEIGGARAFCPASQVDRIYVEDLAVYEGQELSFRVMEVREGGRSIIVSRRALLEAEREALAAEVMHTITPGAVLRGTVSSIQGYGAFVDLGGVEGLIHISELGAGHVASVGDVVAVGEEVEVTVLGVEEVEGKRGGVQSRIRLSMKSGGGVQNSGREPEAPIDATVTKVEGFGVFVQTERGAGLVPTRELDLPPGGDARRAYPVGMELRVVAMGTDPKGNARYSIKKVEDAEARAAYRDFNKGQSKPGGRGGMGSLGALLQEKLGELDVPAAPARAERNDRAPKAQAGEPERAPAARKRTRVGS